MTVLYYRQPFEGNYPITQKYGEKDTSDFHTGIDYACPIGTPILAAEEGYVYKVGYDHTGYGYCVIIQHPDGNATLYAHLSNSNPMVYNNKRVKRSEVIGYSSSTGNSTGPHLHFEARKKAGDYKSHFDPMLLPLHSMFEPMIGADAYPSQQPASQTSPAPQLKGSDDLKTDLEITAPSGAKAFNDDFSDYNVLKQGTKLSYTGITKERNGYTYCKVIPAPLWIAVNDGETQILDNSV